MTSLHAKCKLPDPDTTSVRRAVEGKTHRQDVEETRGRPRKYTRRNVLKMEKTRKKWVAKAKGLVANTQNSAHEDGGQKGKKLN